MTTLSPVPRITISVFKSVTPTITASSYSGGQQIGGIQTITDVVRQDMVLGYGSCTLTDVAILDKAGQAAAFDIWFFSVSPTLSGSDHNAFHITNANMVATTNNGGPPNNGSIPACLGAVSVGSAYSVTGGSQNAVNTGDTNLNKTLFVPGGAANPTNVYAVAVIRTNVTYASTSDLVFQYKFIVD